MGNHVCHVEIAHGFTIYETSALTHAPRMWRNMKHWVCIAPNPATHVQPDALGLLALVQQMLGSLSDAMHFGQLRCSPAFGAQPPLLV